MIGQSMMRRTMLNGVGLAATAALLAAVPGAAQPRPAHAAPLMVIAEIVAKPDDADTLRATMAALAANALKEKGCLSYRLYEDRAHPGRFLTYESWTGDAALDAHLGSPAMKAGAAKFGAMLAALPVITRLKPL